jgi:hypothetical protein
VVNEAEVLDETRPPRRATPGQDCTGSTRIRRYCQPRSDFLAMIGFLPDVEDVLFDLLMTSFSKDVLQNTICEHD